MTRTKHDVAREFRAARDGASSIGQSLKCAGKPELYVDYDIPPSAEQAAALCEGCPIAELCLEYALVTKQAWGVWGGHIIVAGKVLDEVEKVA